MLRAMLTHPILFGGIATSLIGLVEYALSWGTSGLLTVFAAIIVFSFLYFVHKRVVAENQKQGKADNAIQPNSNTTLAETPQPSQPTLQSLHARLSKDGRIFSNRTPQELTAMADKPTALEADRAVRPHIGKWLLIEYEIDDILPPDSYGIVVWLEMERKKGPTITTTCRFDKEWIDRIEILSAGDRITLIGRIDYIRKYKIELEQCELVNQ